MSLVFVANLLQNNSQNFNYSLEAFYDPKITNIYNIFLDTVFVLQSILIPYLIYVILFHSAGMNEYRWYIFNGTVWSYAYGVVIHIWKPVPLFPYFMCYSNGIIKDLLGFQGGFVMLILLGVITVNNLVNIFFVFFIRFYYAAKPGSTSRIFRVTIIFIIFYRKKSEKYKFFNQFLFKLF